MSTSRTLYRALLWCYPAAFRNEYGGEMSFVFTEQLAAAREHGRLFEPVRIWIRAIADAIILGPQEYAHVILQDLRYGARAMAANPGFTAVAALSLALGIGASTALFSIWNQVIAAALPVSDPGQLVILTDPGSAGTSVGQQSGERSLLTWQEFTGLRGQATAFTGLMASESTLENLPASFGGAAWQDVRGRLVSGNYFEVLGVRPAVGRLLEAADETRDAPHAVISYDFWQRAFDGRGDIAGKPVSIRKAALTIIGVAERGFLGETSGQQPDIWISMNNQPRVSPGRERLRDISADKFMWLHVFGRLSPGVTPAQAQDSANAIFQNGLKLHYGTVLSPEKARDFLDQRLVVRPASTGASGIRSRLTEPLKILQWAVGLVLLIACCNVANLLLARGAARQHEMSLRLSLGAGRSRLIRQLFTESLALAALAGVAGLAFAWIMNRALVQLIALVDDSFHAAFGLDTRVLAFSLAVTAVSAAVFGILPALLGTGSRAAAGLGGQQRTSSASPAQLRTGRILVALQLALSLPLLAGAGLLARTLLNLQNASLGYDTGNLLVTRTNFGLAGYAQNLTTPLADELLANIRRIPGVRAATYSENGLFAGTDSGDEIEVEGYVRKGNNDRGSRWDAIGPRYFSTIGIPILLGREVDETDHAGAVKVCVINEAFAKRFFEGRNPIGMRITTIYGDQRNVHRIVGVAANSRNNRLRGDIETRYYVPLSQPLADAGGVVFETRTTGDPAPVLKAIRETIQRRDASIGILHNDAVANRVGRRLAQDRVMALLTACFGLVAVLLSAIGLYGVLAYGVTRRRTEIGIRTALGAEPASVIRMILGEAGRVIAAGLLLGAAGTYAGSQLVRSLLYGLEPNDPATIASAVLLLIAVSAAAAFIPAWRAARLDPVAALRQN